MGQEAALTGPDLGRGIALSDVPDGGMLLGHAFGKAVLIARHDPDLWAVDATCTHYGGPLAEGLLVGATVRCPWHHACFDLRTGAALKAPALRPLTCWNVQVFGDRARVTGEAVIVGGPTARELDPALLDDAIVIVGAGAAGDAAADMLRRLGHSGAIALIGDDTAPPVDRPNLSKDYLAGSAPEEWIPLRAPDYYREQRIDLVSGRRVHAIDRQARRVELDDASSHSYDRLLLATGASPIRLPDAVSGGRILYLRTLADTRSIISAAAEARQAVVVGASFIGLEVAASLRARGLSVHVVAPEPHPLERVMGRAVSDFIREIHESHGVVFHLERTLGRRTETGVVLDNGDEIQADLVIAGIGVRPNEQLARDAGLTVDRGVVVDAHLATADPAIYAAGDVARFPDPRSGQSARIEHWVVAQRQGQTAALNMLGGHKPFHDVPFFWSQHFDATIHYVGHAAAFDDVAVDGNLKARDATITYRAAGKVLAVATIGRDRAGLDAELSLEQAAMAAGVA